MRCCEVCDWQPVPALCADCPISRFPGELRNCQPYPKPVHHVPALDLRRVCEVPPAGGGGHVQFSPEALALYRKATGLFKSLPIDDGLRGMHVPIQAFP